MPITETTGTKFIADTETDIYKIIFTGDEFAPYQRIEVGVDKDRVLRKGKSSQNLLQDNIKNPTLANASGDITIDYKLLSVDRVMSLTTLCPEDWRANFPEFQPSGTTLDLTMNTDVLNMIMELLKNGINTEISDLVYKGDDVLLSPDQLRFFDGYSKRFQTDADVIDVSNIGTITVANVLDIIQDIENAIPARLRNRKGEIKMFMSYTTFDLMMEANRMTQQNATLLTTGNVKKSPSGYEIIPMASVADNEIFATPAGTSRDSNLVRGVWFDGDSSNFLMYREQPSHEDWLIVLKFSMGVQYRTGEDVVYYKGV